MSDFVSRFTSRKFLVAVGAFITLVGAKQYTEAVAAVVAFVGAEAGLDYKALSKRVRTEVDAVDESVQDAQDPGF